MRNCRRARRWIHLDVDRSLPLEDRFRLDEHLAECPDCESLYEHTLGVEEALVRMPEPPEEGLDLEAAVVSIRELLDSDAHTTEAFSAQPRAARWARAVALAAAVAVLASLGWTWLFSRGGESVERGSVATAPGDEPPSDLEAELAAEDVLASLRANLLAARGEGWNPERGDADEFVARFDELSQKLMLWPLPRLAEKLLGDPDPAVACAAARYLGRRGDRISAFRLEDTLGRDEVARAAVRALGDLGERGVSVLARALLDPRRSSFVLVELQRVGGAEAAAAIERTLRNPQSFHPEPGPLLDALAATGPAAVEPLLRLAAEPRLADVRPLEWLCEVEGGGEQLVRVLQAPGRHLPTGLLFEAVAVVQPNGALPWLEERAQELRHREGALQTLVVWEGTAPVESLLRLDAAGRVPGDDLTWALGALAERDAQRMTEHARALLAAGDAIAAGRYLELLLVSGDPRVVPALGPFVYSALLSDEERLLAALAIGEIGGEEDALRLRRGLEHLGPDEKRIYAACLISVYRRLGEPAVAEVVSAFPSGASRQVLTALGDMEQGEAGAIGLSRVARALSHVDRALPKNPKSRNPIL